MDNYQWEEIKHKQRLAQKREEGAGYRSLLTGYEKCEDDAFKNVKSNLKNGMGHKFIFQLKKRGWFSTILIILLLVGIIIVIAGHGNIKWISAVPFSMFAMIFIVGVSFEMKHKLSKQLSECVKKIFK